MIYLRIILLLLLTTQAHAATYWEDSFEAPCGFCNWTDYGLGHSLSITTTDAAHGSQSLRLPYPNGGFLDRFLNQTNNQFNIRFFVKLSSGWQTDSVASKIIYVRMDQSPGAYPNGVLEMISGNRGLIFALQGSVESPNGRNIPLNITLSSTTWQEIEFQYILNTPGQSNGSMTAWLNGVQTFHESDKQYRGATPTSTALDGQINGSNNFVNNIRAYAQFGTGQIFLDRIAVGNSRIGSGGEPPIDNPPGPPGTVTGVTVTVQ